MNLSQETLFCGFQSVLYLFMVLFRLRQYVSWCDVAFRRVHTIRFRWFCIGVFGILGSIGIKLERSSFSFGTWYIPNDTETSCCHIALGYFFHRNRDGFFDNFNYICQGDDFANSVVLNKYCELIGKLSNSLFEIDQLSHSPGQARTWSNPLIWYGTRDTWFTMTQWYQAGINVNFPVYVSKGASGSIIFSFLPMSSSDSGS